MADSAQPGESAPEVLTARTPLPRLASIDIVRGLAILWVIAYHLWCDMTINLLGPRELYGRFGERVVDGRVLPSLTALTDLILRLGYLGVPLFMMLSGVSLTLNAYRKGEPGVLPGYWVRFRRVVPVYWAGVLLVLGTVAALAFLRTMLDGGSFQYRWPLVSTAAGVPTGIERTDVWWAFTVGGWITREKFSALPVGSLWFVPLLLQYYLIFPFALLLLRRAGALRFTLIALAVAIAARAVYVPLSIDALDADRFANYMRALAVLRGSEFFLGMTIGYLLACRQEDVRAWTTSAVDYAGVVILGVLLVTAALLTEGEGELQLILHDPILHMGLALAVLPLLFKAPGRLEVSIVARALVALGVVSFTALIVNDQMRFVASFLREEDIAVSAWWFFLIVVYVPVGTLVAYPLAALFGLLPSQRSGARTSAYARAWRAASAAVLARHLRPDPAAAPQRIRS